MSNELSFACEVTNGTTTTEMANNAQTTISPSGLLNPAATFNIQYNALRGNVYAIDFVCGPSVGTLQYVGTGGGYYLDRYFEWYTSYACQAGDVPTVLPTGNPATPCIADDPATGNHFDLTPLMGTTYVGLRGVNLNGQQTTSGPYNTFFGTIPLAFFGAQLDMQQCAGRHSNAAASTTWPPARQRAMRISQRWQCQRARSVHHYDPAHERPAHARHDLRAEPLSQSYEPTK